MVFSNAHDIVNNAIGKGEPDAAIDDRSVDRAVPSDKKTGPHRLLITVSFDVVGCLIALYPRLPGTSLEAPGPRARVCCQVAGSGDLGRSAQMISLPIPSQFQDLDTTRHIKPVCIPR